MLRVRLLGDVGAELDGRRIEPPASKRAWALLAWLALHPGGHDRGTLAARFWPDVLDSSARASLRSAVWALRRALGPGADVHLIATRERVGLDPEAGLLVDALDFEALMVAGRPADALALGEGELLTGLQEDWAARARDAHRERVLEALEALAQTAERAGDATEAVRRTRAQVALDPLGEEPHRRLMRRLAAGGDRPAALAAYTRLAERLRRELAIAPSGATRRLAEEIRAESGGAGGTSSGTAGPTGGADEIRAESATGAAGATVPGALDRGPPAPGRPPLVGRDRELSTLLACWEGARGGVGAVVSLRGEPGIGKTRLATELLERARAQGGATAACSALDLGGAPPFGLWAELLGELGRTLPEPPDSAEWADDVARLAPGFAARRPGADAGVVAPELERARLFEAVVAAAAWAAAQRALVLLMEDVHLADTTSLELAAYLARRLAALPIVLVLTRRDEPGRDEVDAILHTVPARGVNVTELDLDALAPAAVAELARGIAPLPEHAVERVVEAAEGNPLLAVETARALAAGRDSPAPNLRGAVRVAFRPLPPDARTLAELLAVAGRRLERVEIEALPLRDPDHAAITALDCGLLDAPDGRVGYRHALLREAVYADLAEPRRAWLHETLADMLRTRRRDGALRRAAEVARHLRLARRDQEAVAELASAAADARGVAALGEAANYLAEAVALAPADAGLLAELGEVEAWRGNHDAAVAALERAIAANQDRDPTSPAALHVRAGHYFRGPLCDPPRARRHYGVALDLLRAVPEPPARLRAEALAGKAWCDAVSGDVDEGEACLAEIEQAGLPAPDDHLLSNVVGSARGHILIRRGRFTEAYAPFMSAGEAAIKANRPDRTYDCWGNAAAIAVAAGEPERALDFARRTHAVMRRYGLGRLEVFELGGLAHILLRLGRADEARAAAREQQELADRIGDAGLRAIAEHDAGFLAVELGEDAAGEALLAAALRVGPPEISRPRARLGRAEALVRLGRCDEAEAELRATVLEPVRRSDFPDTLVARLTRVQGLIAARRGDYELARRRLDEAIAQWRGRAGEQRDAYHATQVDLGRVPVLGLIEPARELERALADRDALGEPDARVP